LGRKVRAARNPGAGQVGRQRRTDRRGAGRRAEGGRDKGQKAGQTEQGGPGGRDQAQPRSRLGWWTPKGGFRRKLG